MGLPFFTEEGGWWRHLMTPIQNKILNHLGMGNFNAIADAAIQNLPQDVETLTKPGLINIFHFRRDHFDRSI